MVSLRYLNYLGAAKLNWDKVGYTAEEFLDFWTQAVDYMISLNKKGISIKPRIGAIMLKKIIQKKDPMYTELMSPCGAGRTQILINEDGKVFTCDEGRMIGSDVFKMGDIKTDSYKTIMSSPLLMHMLQASLMDLYVPDSAYLAWNGTCPVEHYSAENNVVSKMYTNRRYKIHQGQFNYLFEHLAEEKESEIFIKWSDY